MTTIKEKAIENINLMVELLEKSYEASNEPNKQKIKAIGDVKLYCLNNRGTEYILIDAELLINNKGQVITDDEFLDDYDILNLINQADHKNEKIILNENAFLKVIELLNFNIKQSKKENEFLDNLKIKLVNLLED